MKAAIAAQRLWWKEILINGTAIPKELGMYGDCATAMLRSLWAVFENSLAEDKVAVGQIRHALDQHLAVDGTVSVDIDAND